MQKNSKAEHTIGSGIELSSRYLMSEGVLLVLADELLVTEIPNISIPQKVLCIIRAGFYSASTSSEMPFVFNEKR